MAESEGTPPSNLEDVRIISNTSKENAAILVDDWTKYATEQVLAYRDVIRETVSSAFESYSSRLAEILTTAYAHSQVSLETLRERVSDLRVYEDAAVGKVKEGIEEAVLHPYITAAATLGLGAIVLKRPRRFLHFNLLRLFVSEEAMILQADAKVKELRHSFNVLKAESEKLEKRAIAAEEEFIRGRTKLRQAGKQIQSAVHSAYKIRREAAGLKEMLGGLPGREAWRFKKQVGALASEVKQEKSHLAKVVNKINNYGISV